ncbi:efflux RND transporter periplasmic adaptor subunit [Leadbettera azotonutricia]|uniref:Membrane fusion protein n=1 Tax=Leadbettera azotonutricia (strain ATCC BAA-888 / DSM 13862 / ZAS-9) TaxID=545695 RepID=F5YC03_LEAAZ|nr:efflux RND transporter periplasmic adaptor subunit [Leadbettera azotonutricia]AEF82441.1 membrane fusion protein [Leadbettera azotonutricia ZAS-9]
MKIKALQNTAFFAVMMITVFSFSGCQRIKDTYGKLTDKAAPGGPGQDAPVFAVNTMDAVQGQISDYLALSGDLVAASTVDAYSEAAGKVSRIMVSIGSYVNKDAPIAEVDPSRPGMQYEVNVVKAPVSGTIVALPAQLGMTVSQAVPLARIASGVGLEIRLYVAERFISRVSLRQSCEISLDAYPGEVFHGRITEISPVVDPSSRTMEVRIGVDSASKLKAGMFAKVRIITEHKNNIVKIPSSALIQRFGEDYVFVAETDPDNAEGFVAVKKIVAPGILIDGVLEIQQGLKPNDAVIVRGQSLLNDGAKVNVVDRIAPLSAN